MIGQSCLNFARMHSRKRSHIYFSWQGMDYRLLGNLLFALFALLAVIYHLERVTMMDSSSYFFGMLSKQSFHYPHHRHGAILCQLLPVGMMKLGLPLRWIMIGYSLSFVLIYYAVYQFCVRFAKRETVGFAVILLYVLGTKYTAHWPVSEMFQATVYSIAFYAWLSGSASKPLVLQVLVAGFWLVLALLTHPLALLCLAFAGAYALVDGKRWREGRFWILAGSLGLMVLAWYVLKAPPTKYEANKLAGIQDLSAHLSSIFESPGTEKLWKLLSGSAKWVWIMSAAVLLYFLLRRSWLKALLLLGALLGYFVVYAVTFRKGNSLLMQENFILPFSLFVALPGMSSNRWVRLPHRGSSSRCRAVPTTMSARVCPVARLLCARRRSAR